MSGVIEDILNKLKECDDFHDRCDCLLEHDEITYLLDYIQQKENIIKEVREYIDKNKASLPMGRDEFTCEMRYSDPVVLARKVLEILDKENRL